MIPRHSDGLQSEPTPEGEQTLVPGIRPITPRERIEALMLAPLTARREQKPLNIGLLDQDARAQHDILDFIRAAEREGARCTRALARAPERQR
jgi:hypothetical protein